MQYQGTLRAGGNLQIETGLIRTFYPAKGGKTESVTRVRNQTIERCVRSPLRVSRRQITGWRNPTEYNRTTYLAEQAEGDVIDYLSDGGRAIWSGSPGTNSTYHKVSYAGLLNANFTMVLDPNLIARADTEALIKVKDQRINIGESMAEMNKTIIHLAKTTSDLAKAYNYARKGQWHKLRKTLGLTKKHSKKAENVSERWLEYQYGWTPLVNDIKASFDLIGAKWRQKDILFSVVRNVRSEGLPAAMHLHGALNNVEYEGTAVRSVKTKYYCKVRNETAAKFGQFGLVDPLQIAWALSPFSFMVDWLLPVGSFLQALTSTLGVDFVSGTRTSRVEFDFTAFSRPELSQSKVTKRFGYFKSRHYGVSMQREVLLRFPPPMLYYKSPFSSTHALSAIAILRMLTLKR